MLWRLMLRKLFTSDHVSTVNRQLFMMRAERRKTHRPRPGVKPQLEILTDRVLLSASPAALPSLAETTASMAAVRNEEAQLIATVQQDVNSLRTMVTQAIAAETALVEQQMDQRLGIRGSGSGSSAMSTADNTQNQPSKTITQSEGRGSGSGAAATAPGSASTPGGHKLPPTNNGSGSGSGSGHMPSVYFSSGSYNVTETGSGAGSHGSGSCPSPYVILQVDDSSSIQSVSVDYSTSDGTAIAGEDYTAESGTVIIPAGQGYQYIHIPILDDGTDESGGPESFYVTLSNPGGAVLGTPSVAQVNIAEAFQQQPTDTLVWNPMCGSTDASDPTNWYDQQIGNNLTKGQPGPGSSTPVILDGTFSSTSNSAIDWTNSVTIASMTIQNGFNAQQTLESNVNLELDGVDGFSLSMPTGPTTPTTSSTTLAAAAGTNELNVEFADYNDAWIIDKNADITNMDLTGNGQTNTTNYLIIAGGITQIGSAAGLTENLGVQLLVAQNGYLRDLNESTLQLTHDDLAITVNGRLQINHGDLAINTVIGGGATFTNDYINVDGGVLEYDVKQNIKDILTVPVAVQNGGTLNVTGDPFLAGALKGVLVAQGGNASTNNVSVYVTGAASLVTLNASNTLEADNGYYQDSAQLETLDNSTCTLQAAAAPNAGTVTIVGGSVSIDSSNNGYGKLSVSAANLNFNGRLFVAIDASNPPTADELQVTGTTNLQANSTLTVIVNNGPPAANKQWVIIDDAKNNITVPMAGFQMPIITDPQTNLNDKIDPNDNTQWLVTS